MILTRNCVYLTELYKKSRKFEKSVDNKRLFLYNTDCCGSLVKRLRRRPLTAKTGVRFPYELFKIFQKVNRCGSLVKRLRRRPLTAKTGVRFPYELFKIFQKVNRCGSLVKRLRRRPLTAKTGVRFPYELFCFL